MKPLFAFAAAWVACLVSGTVIAVAMQPFIAPLLAPHIRTEEMGLNFPALLSGYVVLALGMIALAVLADAASRSWSWVLQTGVVLGLTVFLGDHLITAGWSQLAPGPMAVSGVLDALSILAGFAAGVWVLKRQPAARLA